MWKWNSRTREGLDRGLRVGCGAESLFIDLVKFYRANSLGYWGNDINRPVVGGGGARCTPRWAHQLARRPRGTLFHHGNCTEKNWVWHRAAASRAACAPPRIHIEGLTHNMYYCKKRTCLSDPRLHKRSLTHGRRSASARSAFDVFAARNAVRQIKHEIKSRARYKAVFVCGVLHSRSHAAGDAVRLFVDFIAHAEISSAHWCFCMCI